MIGNHFAITLSRVPALAANYTFRWKVPFQCHLVHVSASQEIEDTPIFTIAAGPAGSQFIIDDDTGLIGALGVPNEYTEADFYSDRPTGRINEGDLLKVTVDYANAPIPPENFTLILTLSEG